MDAVEEAMAGERQKRTQRMELAGGRCLAVATTRGRSLKEGKRMKICGIKCPADFSASRKSFKKNK